jgi:ribose transport system permease protein
MKAADTPAGRAPRRAKLLSAADAVWPAVTLLLLATAFGVLSRQFLQATNLLNVLVQSSSIGIVAVGMTFVLLTSGIDLSVGSIMFLSAAVVGKLVVKEDPLPATWAVLLILLIGMAFGAANAALVTAGRIFPFVATLATLYIGRGAGRWITHTRAMNLPESFLQIGQSRLMGVPTPVVLLGVVVLFGHLVLTRTPFGRQLYAVGHDAAAARKAGIRVGRVLAAAYVLSGLCAALGGVVALGQLGAVSPKFGLDREFEVVAAAVLGGTSLFGGRGTVLPGAIVGALIIQVVRNGLVHVNADPYVYPLVTGGIVFAAAVIDRLRTLWAANQPAA